MKLKKSKQLLLSLSEDGVIVIAEVDREAETQKKKSPWAREYYISKDCLKANLQSKNFTDISKRVDYNGKIYALTEDLS